MNTSIFFLCHRVKIIVNQCKQFYIQDARGFLKSLVLTHLFILEILQNHFTISYREALYI